jgi:hypothetical protein
MGRVQFDSRAVQVQTLGVQSCINMEGSHFEYFELTAFMYELLRIFQGQTRKVIKCKIVKKNMSGFISSVS